eukprot:TRINITY_DN7125_c0_g1_i1.p1 TRINITY_DN7125_c0_g1~~TRINITY_DN7125_c0_g1_i1.p1  ORF type:complete len:384 (-),score=96.47 TRINITY_DN7125_c0_g1_i1:17-1168(-)
MTETGVVSYANIDGEWNDRPISLFGAVKSFYNQLTTGMDVTRISMPCAFFKPYSLLEEIAAKNMAHINLLLSISNENDPLLRILGLGQWLLTSTKQQQFSHKPFNPVIGEIHRSKVIHGDPTDKENMTYMICEQVEHHPPTCSVRIDNPAAKLQIEGYHTFGAQLGRNSVSVVNKGQAYIRFDDEEYYLPRVMPNLYINNLFIGGRYLTWDGEVIMICKKTGFQAIYKIEYSSGKNICNGKIYDTADPVTDEDVPFALMRGECGGKGTWRLNPEHPKNKSKTKRQLREQDLFEMEEENVIPTYPRSQEENSSINTWEEVRKAIIANDMPTADREKVKIEEKQRKYFAGLKQSGEEFESAYFDLDKDAHYWSIKNENWWREYQD